MSPSTEAVQAYIDQVKAWSEQYADSFTCPVTGLEIPKAPAANLAWRKQLRTAGRVNESIRASIKAACASSFVYWVNAFAWTYHQKSIDSTGQEVAVTGDAAHVPFITWKIQDDAAAQIIDCIRRGEDVLIDKARDMGASWLMVSIFQWYFQFVPNSTFLELSRKELYVDQPGNMDSLFEKHRYLLRMQPVWLRPKRVRSNTMLLENQDIGCSIIGESTNSDAGQGGRKTAILIDEAARIRTLEEIDLATADTSACRVYNSTVNGPATFYTRIYREIQAGRRTGRIITLPWEAHPLKGRDISIVDVPVTPKTPLGKKAVSPWYLKEKASRSARDLAQNIDRDHGKSGDVFFDAAEIEQHRLYFQAQPMFIGNLRFDEDLSEDQKRGVLYRNQVDQIRFLPGGLRCGWKIWCPLVKNRPIQTHSYVFGVDISMGSGASNSIISVLDHDGGQKIAEFADAFVTPEDLAWQVCIAGVWFGGKSGRPLLIWETNGPGAIFGRKIMMIGYMPVYFQETIGVKSPRQTEKYGWHSSMSRKEMLLGDYRDALKNGRYINHCKESLDEALDYVYSDTGLLVPATAKAEQGGASATHGDRVVADALCELGRTKLPNLKPEQIKAPAGSYAQMRDRWRRQHDNDNERRVWGR